MQIFSLLATLAASRAVASATTTTSRVTVFGALCTARSGLQSICLEMPECFAVRSLNATSAVPPSRILCFDSALEHCVAEDPTAPRAGDDEGGADVRSIACVETPFGLDCYFNQ